MIDTGELEIVWHPMGPIGKTYDHVPADIASMADEAHRAHSVGCYRSSVILARAVIEAAAKTKGAVKGNLQQKIDNLHEQGHIRLFVKDAAHGIRDSGNDAVHDLKIVPEKEDSSEVLTLMASVLDDIFITGETLKQMKEKREEKVGK
ncbi:DUF4145 domain-containing protein [Sciscionella sediminilitoris]|uniref:DUF4145 domain-containing protein n=1 Tax=Sciscionella sediminilitoris TaxID=1445613 RepID=UPI00068EF386|nr:DUF4145 domain-containing protein [Sciscionella sp. SE31]